MFQGTGSGVGKSIIVAAFCRALKRRGIRVAPFKAQNMALNSFVTADGKEMGRAQVFQAEACGLVPDVRMNPVLLKPSADSTSQVILMGQARGHLSAVSYYERSRIHWDVVTRAYDSLAKDYEVIVMEGAGSPAEINLQKTDIVNMKMAEYAGAPVIIVSDIDRGGVFASLKGTFDLVRPRHRSLIKAFLINKFRGDVRLLEPGIEMFGQIVPVPVLGVLPWFRDIHVDEEDGVFVKRLASKDHTSADLEIAVIRLPRISNFTDFSPFSFEPGVGIKIVANPQEAAGCHMIIIPGTKATTSDLAFLRDKGWFEWLERFVCGDGLIVGICGGYQMLGQEIVDEYGTDGRAGTYKGLSLLPVHTVMAPEKTLRQVRFGLFNPALSRQEMEIQGYEIHMGRTWCKEECEGLGQGLGPEIGVFDEKRGVLGTYIHGIFENDTFRSALLNLVRRRHGMKEVSSSFNYKRFKALQFDLLADWFEGACDMESLIGILYGH